MMKKTLIIAALFATGLAAQAQTTLLTDDFTTDTGGGGVQTDDLNYNLANRQGGTLATIGYTVPTNSVYLTADGKIRMSSYDWTGTTNDLVTLGRVHLDSNMMSTLDTSSFRIAMDMSVQAGSSNGWANMTLKCADGGEANGAIMSFIAFYPQNQINVYYGTTGDVKTVVLPASTLTALIPGFSLTNEYTYAFEVKAESAHDGFYRLWVDGTNVTGWLDYDFVDETDRYLYWVTPCIGEVFVSLWDNLEVSTIPTPEMPALGAMDDMIIWRAGSAFWYMHETEPYPNYLDPDGAGTNTPPASIDSAAAWGLPTDHLPIIGDVNGDGVDDIVITRVGGNVYQWYAGHTSNTNDGNKNIQIGSQSYPAADSSAGLGVTNDIPGNLFLADIDGDGTDDAICVYAGFYWGVFTSSSAGLGGGAWQGQVQFGLPGDQAIMGDFNGDGRDDVGVYRLPGGNIFWDDSAGDWTNAVVLGPIGQIGGGPAGTNDMVLIGNLNGDAYDDAVMVRQDGTGLIQWFGLINDGTGYLDYFNPGTTIRSFGLDGVDTPMLADVNGDGMDDMVVTRGNLPQWFCTFTTAGGALGSNAAGDTSANFGFTTDIPLFGQFSAPPPVEIILDNITLEILSGANDLTLTWATSLDTPYTVETKSSLSDISWTSNSAAVGTGGDVTVTTAVDQAKNFYRVTAP